MYSGIEEVEHAFSKLFLRIKDNGFLIINGDDERLLTIARASGKQMHSYGEKAYNDYVISGIEYNADTMKFVITFKGEEPLHIKLSLSGLHNVYNATAVFAFFHKTGVNGEKIAKALAGFTGAVRRLEHHASVNGNEVYDDYAHHPTEIAATIEALKKKHPSHKIVVFFQPHTYTRTKAFKDEFIMSLSKADRVGILPIFASAREITDNNISTEELIREAKIRGITYFDIINTDADWKKIIHEVTASNKKGVFVTMGAGDIYKNTVFITNTLHEHE